MAKRYLKAVLKIAPNHLSLVAKAPPKELAEAFRRLNAAPSDREGGR